jgi:hypothetical protein
MRIIALLAAAALLTGCVSTYRETVVAAPGARMQRGASIAIATSIRGSYRDTNYYASGRDTAKVLRAAFAPYTDKIIISEHCSDIGCLKGDAWAKSDYYVVPEILRWEDAGLNYTLRPNRFEIKLTIYSSGSNTPLGSTILSGRSRTTAFIFGEGPEDLLPREFDRYVRTLY